MCAQFTEKERSTQWRLSRISARNERQLPRLRGANIQFWFSDKSYMFTRLNKIWTLWWFNCDICVPSLPKKREVLLVIRHWWLSNGYSVEFHIFIFKFWNIPAINVGCDQRFEAIANTFGLFSSIKNVSKRAARIGLLLSTAKPVLELSDQEIGKISLPNHKKSRKPLNFLCHVKILMIALIVNKIIFHSLNAGWI